MQRGEIYIVDLGASVGNEHGGMRPVVVVSSDVNNLHPYTVIVIAGQDTALAPPESGVFVPASDSGASMDLVFFIHQLRSLDPARFNTGPIGVVPDSPMQALGVALKVHLDLPNFPPPKRP